MNVFGNLYILEILSQDASDNLSKPNGGCGCWKDKKTYLSKTAVGLVI